jgi:hypothetical protein
VFAPCALPDQQPHGPLISGFSLDGMDQPYSGSEKLALNVNALIKAPTLTLTLTLYLYALYPNPHATLTNPQP